MNLKRTEILLATLLAFSLLLTACSSGKSAGDNENSLQRVLNAGKITVVGSGGYPPFNYFDNNGDVVGFDVDVGQEIANRLAVDLDYVTGDWDGLVEGLRNKRYDGILGSMAITAERLEVVSFSDPYYIPARNLLCAVIQV